MIVPLSISIGVRSFINDDEYSRISSGTERKSWNAYTFFFHSFDAKQ